MCLENAFQYWLSCIWSRWSKKEFFALYPSSYPLSIYLHREHNTVGRRKSLGISLPKFKSWSLSGINWRSYLISLLFSHENQNNYGILLCSGCNNKVPQIELRQAARGQLFVVVPPDMWNLSSQPWIKLMAPALEGWSLNPWTTKEVPHYVFIYLTKHCMQNSPN